MPNSTRKIVIFDPSEDLLAGQLSGRSLSPALAAFLKGLVHTKKWARKINIPSGERDVAAALVFTTVLKEGGLEITSELHVFLEGKVKIDRWQVAGENERIALLPKEVLRALDIAKVHHTGNTVDVELTVPTADGSSAIRVKRFDFSEPD